MTNPIGYDCDYCGACCRNLLVEADYVDALREPRLLQISHLPNQPTIEGLLTEDKVIFLAGHRPCPFLTPGEQPDTHVCSIYDTRPHCCVAVLAGDAKCQQARKLAGLKPLKPTGPPTIDPDEWNEWYDV